MRRVSGLSGVLRRLGMVGGLVAALTAPVAAQTTVTLISHRYPALEHYAKVMDGALPGVKVNANLMPVDKMAEVSTLALSQGSDAYDVVWTDIGLTQRFAAKGWLEPLDAYWQKYRAEFKLDDFPESVLAPFRYGGKLYAMPFNANAMFFFYRADLLKEAGKQPPRTMDEFRDLAALFTKPPMAGTVMSLRPPYGTISDTHWYLHAFGGRWLDEKNRPVFNSPEGVKAVEFMKQLSQYAPRGFSSFGNDEAMVSFQQGLAAMGLQWVTRAAAMDDANRSKVVGKIDWVAPPGGGNQFTADGYTISKFSKQNKETLFRLIATTGSPQNMRGAAGLSIPVRASLLEDAQLKERFRFLPAALEAVKVGRPLPTIPEWPEVQEVVARRIMQAITGEAAVKASLDTAADEVRDLLKKRGYAL
jgi:ABC-type glycerol-3-phosphate transport system substrate-binding protein